MTQASTNPTSRTQHRYLKVEDLRRLQHLFFASKRAVEGHYAGRHASPQRGHSVEFNDYREYTPGDEIGDIDWKVFGRSDRLFIKLFEHQSDMTVNLLVDGSGSMGYPGPKQHRKWDQACMLAAAIGFLTVRQQDRVSFGVARRGLAEFHRPAGGAGHLNNILRSMEEVTPTGEAQLPDALKAMARQTTRKGLLVLLSDLMDDAEPVLRALSLFTHRGNEVILLHVLHADEFDLPADPAAVFVDSETQARLRININDIREQYRQRLQHYLDGWQAACRARGMDYRLVSTAQPYHEVLAGYLFTRASLV